MAGRTNLTAENLGAPVDPKLYKTHEGEHHGDFSGSGIPVTRATKLFVACAALNSCNLGYDVGVSSNAGPLIQRNLGLTDVQRELFVGSLNLWSIFGSIFAHWICDRYVSLDLCFVKLCICVYAFCFIFIRYSNKILNQP